jgi:hypothetical protein
MPSLKHKNKIEEIDREIKSRGMDWRTRRNYPIWLHKENVWGQIDIIGFKKETIDSPAIIDAYEIEELSSNIQKNRNLMKLKQLKASIPKSIKVFTCQLSANEDHRRVCHGKNGNQ